MPSAAEPPRELTGRPVQLQGSALARLLLRAAGWRVLFHGLPARRGVVIIYPHTSNWDFVVGIMAKWSIGIPVTFWGKSSLFRVPLFGAWLRWLGGVPVDRERSQGAVQAMIERFEQAHAGDEFLWLALAPEGTRRASGGWRSGFYRVALGAGVPLGLAYLDFAQREVGVVDFLQISGNREADMAAIAARLGHHRGRRPACAAPIRLKE